MMISTGDAARMLQTTEPRLGELIRRGKIDPEPPIVAGRRLWQTDHIRQAARALDRLTDRLEDLLAGSAEDLR